MNEIANAHILVTGGAGFVGSNLVKRLISFDPASVMVVDNLLSSERSNLPKDPSLGFIEGSIADASVLAQLDDRFDYVFHLATYHGNQSSIHDPIADHENNTLTTLMLFNHMCDFKRLKKVVYASAGCAVADKTFDDATATTEEAPPSLYMDSPYSISKIMGEYYANYYFARHALPVVKARFQNVYGPGEFLGAGRWRGTPATVWRNVTPTFIYRALNQMPLVLENGGIATRDFIYVDDIVNGLLLCATKGGAAEVYNLASGSETSIRALAEQINDLAKNPVPVELGETRDWDRSGKRFGSTDKSRRALGFEVETSLSKGLEATVAWTRENMAKIDACIAKHAAHMAIT